MPTNFQLIKADSGTTGSMVVSNAHALTMFGTPTVFNVTATNLGTTVTNGGVYYYLGNYPSNVNENFNPIVTSSFRYRVPVNGLYAVKFTLASLFNAPAEVFIGKNLVNNNDLNARDDRLVACVQIPASMEYTISGSVTMTTSDYLAFGLFMNAGARFTTTTVQRNQVQIFCLQRTN